MKRPTQSFRTAFLLLLISLYSTVVSQKSTWTITSPFKNDVFIENNGQFDNPNGMPLENIHYALANGRLHVYFTPAGIRYSVYNFQPNAKSKEEAHENFEKFEKSVRNSGKPEMDTKNYFTDRSAFINIEWAGANPDAIIIASDKVPDHYSYSVTYKRFYENAILLSGRCGMQV